jgi:catechol 2,3-dioxygenase-like lactoylglutathione lyase family enzyme
MTVGIMRLLRVGLNVSDLDRSSAFYRDALGFSIFERQSYQRIAGYSIAGSGVRVRTGRVKLGLQEIELRQFDPPGLPYPEDSTASDLWFQHCAIVVHDMADAYERLQRHGPVAITQGGPQRLPPAAGSVVAYKFRDPDGHPLELIHFPLGSGDARWQAKSPMPTLGIDHSALSVSDAARSIAFYQTLGLSMTSRQTNTGPAQNRLDGLLDVRVDVIAMSPVETLTPHVELLSYNNPRGRAAPLSEACSDIAGSSLIFEVANLVMLIQELASTGLSPVLIVNDESGVASAQLRDPDGHLINLLQEPEIRGEARI